MMNRMLDPIIWGRMPPKGSSAELWDKYFSEKLEQNPDEATALRMVKHALERGASVNQRLSEGLAPLFADGMSILCWAVWANQYDLVKYLLEQRADVNQVSIKGKKAPIDYIYNGDERMAQMLLDAGADVNQKDSGQCTALYNVLFHSNRKKELTQLLVEAGGDYIRPTSTRLSSPFYFASIHPDVSEYLLSVGAPIFKHESSDPRFLNPYDHALTIWQQWCDGGCDISQIDHEMAMKFSNANRLHLALEPKLWHGHEDQLRSLWSGFAPQLQDWIIEQNPNLILPLATPQPVVQGWSAKLSQTLAEPMRGRASC